MINGPQITQAMPAPSRGLQYLCVDNCGTSDIMQSIALVDSRSAPDTAPVAAMFAGPNVLSTCRNIWHYLRNEITYKEDTGEVQYAQSPAQLVQSKQGDCKSFALFAASVLKNLGIPHCYRFVWFDAAHRQGHVYVIVPTANGQYITIDGTLARFNNEASAPYRKDMQATMPRAAIGAAPQRQIINPVNLTKPALDGICSQLRSQNKGYIANAYQQQWNAANNSSSRIAGPLMDRIRNSALKSTLKAHLVDASPFFFYLYYPESQFANQFKRFPTAVDKLINGMELYKAIVQKSDGLSLGFNWATWTAAITAYRAGNLAELDRVYRQVVYPAIKGSDMDEIMWNAAANNLNDKWVIEYMRTKGLNPLLLVQLYKRNGTTNTVLPQDLRDKFISPIDVIDSWIAPELAKEWEVWNLKPTLALGNEFESIPFANADEKAAFDSRARKGAKLNTNQPVDTKGLLGVWLTVPPGITAEKLIGDLYTPPVLPNNSNAVNKGKKLNVLAKPIFFAAGPELYGTNFTKQLYTREYNTVRQPQLSADGKQVLIVLNKTVDWTGKKAGGAAISNMNPTQNKNTAGWFQGFGFNQQYTPGPVSISGAKVGFIDPVTIAIIISSVVAAVLAIIAAVVAAIKDIKTTDGSVAVPQQPDFSRNYVGEDGATYSPQPDGSTNVYDPQGNFLGSYPPGAAVPPPAQDSNGNLWLYAGGAAALLALYLFLK